MVFECPSRPRVVGSQGAGCGETPAAGEGGSSAVVNILILIIIINISLIIIIIIIIIIITIIIISYFGPRDSENRIPRSRKPRISFPKV